MRIGEITKIVLVEDLLTLYTLKESIVAILENTGSEIQQINTVRIA